MYILTHMYSHQSVFTEMHAWMSIKVSYVFLHMYLCDYKVWYQMVMFYIRQIPDILDDLVA